VSRLAAVCCCNTDPATSPCLQWVTNCIGQFPTTVTVSFSGSYLLQQIDLCNPTVEIVTYRDYITYSGLITGVAASPYNLLGGFEGQAWTTTGTATASWRRDTFTNLDNGTTCGVWRACSTETLPSQNMQLAFGFLVCQRNTADGNQWSLNALFQGTGTYSLTTAADCCNPVFGCPPFVYDTPTALRVQGLFGSGCDAPMPPIEDFPNCNCPTAGLQVTFTRGDDTAVIAGPFRIQNATYFDDALTQRHTYTGTASVSFT
jgi:hypothetical protein